MSQPGGAILVIHRAAIDNDAEGDRAYMGDVFGDDPDAVFQDRTFHAWGWGGC